MRTPTAARSARPVPHSLLATLGDALRAAGRRWPALLVTGAATMVPALVAREVIGLASLGGSGTVVDGVLTPLPSAAAGGAGLAVLALGWALALVAGTAIAAGSLRDVPVRPRAALALAVRRLPALVPALLLLAVAGVGLQVATVLTEAFVDIMLPGELAAAVTFAVFVLALVLLASRLLTVPAIVLGDGPGAWLPHAHAVAAGRVLPTGGVLAVGAVVLPLLIGMGADALAQDRPALTLLLATVPAVLGPGVQGAALATVYLQRRPAGDPGTEPDLDRVDTQLRRLSPAAVRHAATSTTGFDQADHGRSRSQPPGTDQTASAANDAERGTMPGRAERDALGRGAVPPSRRWGGRLAVAGALASLLLPALVAVGAAASDPYGGPRVTRQPVSWSGEVLAASWPRGGHPVVVTDYGPHWCLDDACREVQSRQSEPLMLGSPMPATAITGGGDVVSAGVRGREPLKAIKTGGNDAVQMQRCTAPWAPATSRPKPGSCEDGITRWHTGGRDGEPQLAVAAGPDGSIVVATARPLARTGGGPQRVELAVTRCDSVHCHKRTLDRLGTVAADLDEWLPGGSVTSPAFAPLLRLDLDAQDRPVLLLRDPAGWRAWRAACDTAACDHAAITEIAAPERVTDPAVLLPGEPPRLVAAVDTVTFRPAVSLAQGPSGRYVLGLDERLAAPVPLTPAERGAGRLVLWHCPPGAADRARRVALPLVQGELYQAALAVSDDGRVLVTYSDSGLRYAVLVTGRPNPGKGPYCTGLPG